MTFVIFCEAKITLNNSFSLQTDSNGLESYEYVMKIVPTTYEDISGNSLIAYQYTYAFRRQVKNIYLDRQAVHYMTKIN